MSLVAERSVAGRLARIGDPDDEALNPIEEEEDHYGGRAGHADFGPATSSSSSRAGGIMRMRAGKSDEFAPSESGGSRGSDWRDPEVVGKQVSFAPSVSGRDHMSGTLNPRRSVNEAPRPFDEGDWEGHESHEAPPRRTFKERAIAWVRGLQGKPEGFQGRSSLDGLSVSFAHNLGNVGRAGVDGVRGGMMAGLAAAHQGVKQTTQGLSAIGAGMGLLEQDDDVDLAQEELEAEEKSRTWELIMEMRAIEYVGKDETIDCFFAATVEPDNPNARQGVRVLPEFTPAFILKKGKKREDSRLTLENPHRLYERQTFKMSYKRLRSHVLKIDMWKVSNISFNTYVGVGTKVLHQVATSEANMSIKIRQTLTQHDKDEMKKKKITSTPDIAVFEGTIVCEEVFDFQLACENWLLEMNSKHPENMTWLSERKSLTFALPRSALSNASSRRRCKIVRTPWSPDTTKFFWGALGLKKAVQFRGTRTSLQNSFFVVVVHSGNTLLEQWSPMNTIGTALMGLTSVLDISVFRGRAKSLAIDEESFSVAVLTGSIRCTERSVGHKEQEVVPGGRPKQPKSERTVSHLSSKEMHLVVRVAKCEGLPVGDQDTGTSDPFLRVLWDNGVQTSQTISKTLRPVFNFNIYFPVRFFNPKIMHARYRDTALMYELASKGDITLQVWDDDNGTSADYLGGTKVHMWQLLASKVVQQRTLLGQPVKAKDSDAEFELTERKVKQWFEQDKEVRVFDGAKTELVGCSMAKTETALIYFEAYFYPDDWPDDLENLRREEEGEHHSAHWRKKDEWFQAEAKKFAQVYGHIFPDSVGAKPPAIEQTAVNKNKALRRFPCVGLHPQTLTAVPLMAYLAKIVAPEEYTRPAMLLHWMNCITFCNTEAQNKTGRIPEAAWKDPQTLLSARKGSVQDHAILLCSILLGHGSDAYVCKGTVWREETTGTAGKEQSVQERAPKLVEHVWVMTRHEDTGWVTFWEPCSREMYHLPRRCNLQQKLDFKKKPRKMISSLVDSLLGDEHHNGRGWGKKNTSDDLDKTEQDATLLGGSGPAGASRYQPLPKAKAKMGKAARKLHQDNLVQERQTSELGPDTKLLDPEGRAQPTLVDWLPYDSIDVVFNRENVWANHLNHHPACIMYNMNSNECADSESAGWMPLLRKDELHSADFKVDFISSEDVTLEPESQPDRLAKLEGSLVAEMKENMRLMRQKKGKDTNWDRDPGHSIQSEVNKFLFILEKMRRLDVEFCPWHDRELTEAERYITERLGYSTEKSRYNVHGSPFERDCPGFETYPEEQRSAWQDVVNRVQRFLDRRKSFPTKKGKVFRGIPIHFSTSDKEEIRNYLMEDEQYNEEVLDFAKDEGVLFSVHCKMFGLLGGIQSVWLYFGVQEPMEQKSGNQRSDNHSADDAGHDHGHDHHDHRGGHAPDTGAGVGLMD